MIYVEDLRSLEARGMGRTLNTRLSQTVRGQITDRMRHLAAEARDRGGDRPRPRHLQALSPLPRALRHCKAPTARRPGWKWAVCPACGWQGDRDTGAWQRIAARGLAHQATTVTDRDHRDHGHPRRR